MPLIAPTNQSHLSFASGHVEKYYMYVYIYISFSMESDLGQPGTRHHAKSDQAAVKR